MFDDYLYDILEALGLGLRKGHGTLVEFGTEVRVDGRPCRLAVSGDGFIIAALQSRKLVLLQPRGLGARLELSWGEGGEEDREAAELAVLDFKKFVRSRCCLFLDDEKGGVLHGRIEGLVQEIDTLVLRDLRPGRERLQCRLQVPYDNVQYACHSGSLAKCKQCRTYEELGKGRAGRRSQ